MTPDREPEQIGRVVSCEHPERDAMAWVDTPHGGEEHVCLECALFYLREGWGSPVPEMPWRDLIRTRFDRPGFRLYFAYSRAPSVRCECPCDHRAPVSDPASGGIAEDRLICSTCLQAGHAVNTGFLPGGSSAG